jgi:hypothetical protein
MKPILGVSGAALAIALTLATAGADTDGRVGVNALIRNSVQTKSASESALHPAVVRAPVHIGDAVVSGNASQLQILMLDKSVFTVGANARMTIDRFVYDPDRGTSDVAASIAKGAFRFMSGRSLSGFGRNAITTPVATIGVRGTIVEGVVGADALKVLAQQGGLPPFSGDPGNVTLVLLGGPGVHTQGFDKPGAIDVTSGGVTVGDDHAGWAVLVFGPGQPPFGPFPLSDAAFAALSDLLRTDPGPGTDEGPDVESAGNGSGDTLDDGAPGEPYPHDTTTLELPPPPRGEINTCGGDCAP